MPLRARQHQLTQSLIYHVYNRSSERKTIFNAEPDFNFFIYLLRKYSKKFSLKLYHWVIMSNHYHLLLELADPESISSLMAGLNRSYTWYHHNAYSSVGFLWQGRFKLQPVQKETYLSACGRYIERNPVEAGMVLESNDYPYSSAAFYCSGKDDALTAEDPLFLSYGKSPAMRRAAYKEFLRDFNAEEERCFEDREQPVGDTQFIRKLLVSNGRQIPRRKGRAPERFVSQPLPDECVK